ncbi:MAG: DUF3800 domain-containing protein [Armatimonadetes bacterium]|nr:DUF3800 domain-containing protein [Armatimonadota bacterium]
MPEKEYIIFCDESDKDGKYYSNFYGGVLVGASQYQRVTDRLNTLKKELNLFGEIKWAKVTQTYLPKYEQMVRAFFEEIIAGKLKVRVMFTQNALEAQGLTEEHIDQEYFILYYQFVKHAFGLRHLRTTAPQTRLRLYFDQFPDTKEKVATFKGYLHGLQHTEEFRKAGITIAKEDIAEVHSHDHVLLQCLDIVVGAMTFRLNDKHRLKRPGERLRGKRTIAKDKLYKIILQEIRKTHPGFNIGISTGRASGVRSRWTACYAHWCFRPASWVYHASRTKRQKENPT